MRKGSRQSRSLVVALLLVLTLTPISGEDKELLFSFITTLTGDFVSSGAIPMVDLALEQINNHSDILPGYRLGYTTILDSECSHLPAMAAFFYHFQNISQPKYTCSFCCGCSVATIPVAEIVHHWNVPQMSFSSAANVLSNRKRFPGFFRTTPSFEHVAHALERYMQEFNWTQLAVITQSESVFVEITLVLESLLERQGWKIHSTLIMSRLKEDFPYEDLFDYDEEDYRIVFINTYEDYAARILCEAYLRGKNSSHVWITHGFYDELWWSHGGNSSCLPHVMWSMVNRSLAIIPDGYLLKDDPGSTISGLTEEEFEAEYEKRLKSPAYSNLHEASDVGLAFDATWAIAIGLDNAWKRIVQENETGCENLIGTLVPLENFNYTNQKMGCVLNMGFEEIHFQGVTGKVAFDHNGSREDQKVDLEQYRMQEDGDHDVLEIVASVTVKVLDHFFQYADNESALTIWPDGVPYDGAIVEVIHPNHISLVIVYSILAGVGLCYSNACLIFNFVFRKRRIVKMASPNLNYLIILGATLMYSSVYFYVFSTDDFLVGTIHCNVREWLFSIGYTLCFGVVLAKTWRVYYIFNKPSLKKNKKLIKDWILFLIVIIIVLVDATVLLIGTSVPHTRLNATLVPDGEHGMDVKNGINEDHFTYVCVENAITWLAVSYSYKGLLQILAMFMAFHIRNVKIRVLNETAQIIAIVYVNSIILIVLVVAYFVLPSYHDIYASLFAFAMMVGATVFLSLIFIPKMVSLYRDPDGTNVFSDETSTENGTVQGIKQRPVVNLTGFKTVVEKPRDADESVSVLRTRVSYLEKQLAEAERKLQALNAREPSAQEEKQP